MSNKKQGFSLAEILIVISIIGVLATISISVMQDQRPNEELVMFKKAYNIAARLIDEIINDDEKYWDDDVNEVFGFANTKTATVKGKSYSGDTKFCRLFAEALNTVSSVSCTTQSRLTASSAPGDGTFRTSDNIVWQLPITSFKDGDTTSEDNYFNIIVDVTGDGGNNCFEDDTGCTKPDRFIIQFNHLGAIKLPGTLEKEYMKTNKTNKKYNEIKGSFASTAYKKPSEDGVVTFKAELNKSSE